MSRLELGRNIYSQEWDLLIILDTCRVDALKIMTSEFEFLDKADIKSVFSLGSETPEWLCMTFTPTWINQVYNTSYISGNAWTEPVFERGISPAERWEVSWAPTSYDVVSANDFSNLIHCWKYVDSQDYFYDGQAAPHPTPEVVTDHTIDEMRSTPNRVIAHYKQPHAPYDSAVKSGERNHLFEYEKRPFQYLKSGGDKKDVWMAYLDELRFVLDDIRSLLQNAAAERVVVTADHGEAFGEWEIYGHSSGRLHPKVKVVPWIEISATDTGERRPDMARYESTNISIDDQLKALGYK